VASDLGDEGEGGVGAGPRVTMAMVIPAIPIPSEYYHIRSRQIARAPRPVLSLAGAVCYGISLAIMGVSVYYKV
jgi:hypothetical protein